MKIEKRSRTRSHKLDGIGVAFRLWLQPITRARIEHWFTLPLLLATPTMQFSLDRSNGVISGCSVLLLTPSVWFALDYIALRFWSRLRLRLRRQPRSQGLSSYCLLLRRYWKPAFKNSNPVVTILIETDDSKTISSVHKETQTWTSHCASAMTQIHGRSSLLLQFIILAKIQSTLSLLEFVKGLATANVLAEFFRIKIKAWGRKWFGVSLEWFLNYGTKGISKTFIQVTKTIKVQFNPCGNVTIYYSHQVGHFLKAPWRPQKWMMVTMSSYNDLNSLSEIVYQE